MDFVGSYFKMSSKIIAIVAFVLFSLFTTSLFICVFFLYIPTLQSLVTAECIVKGCEVTTRTCSYQTCVSGGGKVKTSTCTTHYYECFDSSVNFYLTLDENVYEQGDTNTYSVESNAYDRCNQHPANSFIVCYYDKRSVSKTLSLVKSGPVGGAIAAIVIFTIFSFVALAVLAIMAVSNLGKIIDAMINCFNYFTSCSVLSKKKPEPTGTEMYGVTLGPSGAFSEPKV